MNHNNLSFRFSLLLIITIFSFSAYSQVFEGELNYSARNTSEKKEVTDFQIRVYIKGPKYRIEMKEKDKSSPHFFLFLDYEEGVFSLLDSRTNKAFKFVIDQDKTKGLYGQVNFKNPATSKKIGKKDYAYYEQPLLKGGKLLSQAKFWYYTDKFKGHEKFRPVVDISGIGPELEFVNYIFNPITKYLLLSMDYKSPRDNAIIHFQLEKVKLIKISDEKFDVKSLWRK